MRRVSVKTASAGRVAIKQTSDTRFFLPTKRPRFQLKLWGLLWGLLHTTRAISIHLDTASHNSKTEAIYLVLQAFCLTLLHLAQPRVGNS